MKYRSNKLLSILLSLALLLSMFQAYGGTARAVALPDDLQAAAATMNLTLYDLSDKSAGDELDSGIYFLTENKLFAGTDAVSSASAGGNGLRIKNGADVYIYLADGVTLTVTGGSGYAASAGADATGAGMTESRQDVAGVTVRSVGSMTTDGVGAGGAGASGGGAGILVPSDASLTFLGTGTVSASGGAGGGAGSGGRGGITRYLTTSLYVYGGAEIHTETAPYVDEINWYYSYYFYTNSSITPYADGTGSTGADPSAGRYDWLACAPGGGAGGGAGGGGAAIGSNGASGSAGANGAAVAGTGANDPSVSSEAGATADAVSAISCGSVYIASGVTATLAVGRGGAPGTQPPVTAEISSGDLTQVTDVDGSTGTSCFKFYDGQTGGSGGAGGDGAEAGTGGGGGAGGQGGSSGSGAKGASPAAPAAASTGSAGAVGTGSCGNAAWVYAVKETPDGWMEPTVASSIAKGSYTIPSLAGYDVGGYSVGSYEADESARTEAGSGDSIALGNGGDKLYIYYSLSDPGSQNRGGNSRAVLLWAPDTSKIEPWYNTMLDYYAEMTDVNVTVKEKRDSIDLTADDLADVQFVYLMMVKPDADDNYSLLGDNNANVQLLRNFLNAGGRIIMNGEHSGFCAKSNAALSKLAAELGADFRIADGVIMAHKLIANTDHKSELIAGAEAICPSAYAPIVSNNTETAVWVFKGVEKGVEHVFVMDQPAGNGYITALADINWLNYGDAANVAAAKKFLRNTLRASAAHMEEIAENTHKIFGMVTRYTDGTSTEDARENVPGASVVLKQGNRIFAETVTDADANYVFNYVPDGEYNIVVTDEYGKTKTEHVVVTSSDQTANVILPYYSVSSVVEVSGDNTPAVVVGGLDVAALHEKEASGNVVVTLTAESKADLTKTPDAGLSDEEKKTRTDQIVIGAANTGSDKADILDFIDVSVIKQATDGGDTTESAIHETSEVLEIIVPYTTAGRTNFRVFRRHLDGPADVFARITGSRPEAGFTDQTFWVGDGFLVIYAKFFSTYAIGYDPVVTPKPAAPQPAAPQSRDTYTEREDKYPVKVNDAANGKASSNVGRAAEGARVKITVSPNKNCTLDTLTAVDADGNPVALMKLDDTTYTYTQPARGVTVTATFRAAEPPADPVCPRDAACPIWPFTDTNLHAWYHDGVHWALEKGVMGGYNHAQFGPNDTTTRAQVAVMLWRLAGSPQAGGDIRFADVPEGMWYTDAVRWATSAGVITGQKIPSETAPWPMGFLPDDPVTREQLAAMLCRFARYQGMDVGRRAALDCYPDAASVSAWAADTLSWAAGTGVVSGTQNGTRVVVLDPQGSATRAQVATMFMRYCTQAANMV